MGILKPVRSGPAYLKAGFLGFNGSGKTYTAVELALGTRKHFKLTGPVAFFATEPGLSFFAKRVLEETGSEPLGVESYSLDDLVSTAKECVASGVSVLVVDSVTHVWRELCDSALKQINDRLKSAGKKPRMRLEMQDWSAIKAKWAEWSDLYVNAPLHIIVCGRAGYEFDHDVDAETGKKTLVKTGVKMRAEGEFGFEPSLLIEMEREQILEPDHVMVHKATVLKDRFSLIDGRWQNDPTFSFFLPHVAQLGGGEHRPIDTVPKTNVGLGEDDGTGDWYDEKRRRNILSEEIQGELARAYPGQSADHKAARQALLEKHFRTLSWTRISESTHSNVLRGGLDALRAEFRPPPNDNPMPENFGAPEPMSDDEKRAIEAEEARTRDA